MAFRMSEQPRTIKIYNLLAGTNEFIGEGDAYIPPHTGLPANSTDSTRYRVAYSTIINSMYIIGY